MTVKEKTNEEVIVETVDENGEATETAVVEDKSKLKKIIAGGIAAGTGLITLGVIFATKVVGRGKTPDVTPVIEEVAETVVENVAD